MSSTPRFLVVEGNLREASEALAKTGATPFGELYARTLQTLHPGAVCDIVRPADPDGTLPSGAELRDYDGVAWTGSALNVYTMDPPVMRQVELAREVYDSGVPFFGSCWALQVAVVAAGGVVRKHPVGRELGIARKIHLTEEGERHPMFAGKPKVFEAVCIHQDEVETLPVDSTLLASNNHSHVQAAEIRHGRGSFWGIQYHPEYDLREIGRICLRYKETLTEQGWFESIAACEAFVARLDALHADPVGRKDLRWQLGVDSDVLDEAVRLREIRNWIDYRVLPEISRRR